jgi:transposase-like protein
VARPTFPKTLREFQSQFSSEEACQKYLASCRWPDGFVCPRCGNQSAYELVKLKRWQCTGCRHQVSVTAQTILHNTKIPLTVWFWAAYLMTTDKRGISALLLQRQLGLRRYETAWMMLHKLRRAMINLEREPLRGEVEVDETWIGRRWAFLHAGDTCIFYINIDFYIEAEFLRGERNSIRHGMSLLTSGGHRVNSPLTTIAEFKRLPQHIGRIVRHGGYTEFPRGHEETGSPAREPRKLLHRIVRHGRPPAKWPQTFGYICSTALVRMRCDQVLPQSVKYNCACRSNRSFDAAHSRFSRANLASRIKEIGEIDARPHEQANP